MANASHGQLVAGAHAVKRRGIIAAERGVAVGVGTDGAGSNNDLDLWEEIGKERYGVTDVVKREKPVAGPPKPEVLDALSQCDFVLVGSAD